MEKFVVAALLFYSLFPLTIARTVCPIGSQRIISTDRTLLPLSPQYLQATSEYVAFGEFVENIVDEDTSKNWCADALAPTEDQHVNITFTEEIVLTAIMSRGSSIYYVNNFTVEYSLNETFTPYHVYQYPQNFIVPEVPAIFVLEVPITALQFRLDINGAQSTTSPCWKLIFYGCTLLEAEEVDIEPAPVETETVFLPCTPTPQSCSPQSCPPQECLNTCTVCSTPTPGVCSTPAPGEGDAGAQSSQASETSDTLAVVLPIALVTILVVAGIVVGGVLICIRYQRVGKLKVKNIREVSGGSVKLFDNSELYQLPDHNESSREDCQRSDTIKHVDNVLYGPGTETETGNSTGDRVYETVDSMQEKEDDMEYNQNYSIPFQDQSVQMKQNECYNASGSESAGPSSNGYSYAKVEGNQWNDS